MTAHSLYIHWPFCAAKCPYCDFNSYVSSQIDEALWLKAYCDELLYYKNNYDISSISTIFFGGGTPSLMSPDLIDNIIQKLHKMFQLKSNIEITLEANPTSSEAEKFKAYRQAGVTRLSMGIQAFNDHDLKKLGRTHSLQEALYAFEEARQLFDYISFDLIYARENQTLKAWEEELEYVMSYAANHISLYQLTIEEGTRFADWYKRGKLTPCPDDIASEMYFLTIDFLESYGFSAYEISNFARPGHECQHNLNYWRYNPYIGIGPGAHGRVYDYDGQYHAIETILKPETYITAEDKIASDITLTSQDQDLETLLMGLRLQEGVDLSKLTSQTFNQDALSFYAQKGFLIYEEGHKITLTKKGRPVMNNILLEIL